MVQEPRRFTGPKKSNLLGDDYMALDMKDAQVHESGLLFSPLLHGSLNQTCKLSFTRHIKSSSRACQLSVFMVTETNWTLLWRTLDKTGVVFSEESPDLQNPCTETNFEIVFEVKRIRSGSCGGTVDIDDIEFYYKQEETSTTMPTTTMPTTTMASSPTFFSTTLESTETTQSDSENSTVPQEPNSTTLSDANSDEFKDTGLSSGAVAAVVVVVIAVIIIVSLILVLLFLRRRAREQGGEGHWISNLCRKRLKTPLPRSSGVSAAFTNGSYVLRNSRTQENEDGSTTIHRGGHGASLHVYTTAEDTGYELSPPNTNTTTQDDYNVLSRKAPPGPPSGPLPEDHYNHLNDHADEQFQHSKATPDQDLNSYSLAKPTDAFVTTNTTTTPKTATDYEIVVGEGNRTAPTSSASPGPDIYNRLGETVGSRDDNPQNHYDHFHDTDGQYSSTNMEESTRDHQRKLASDLYSHA